MYHVVTMAMLSNIGQRVGTDERIWVVGLTSNINSRHLMTRHGITRRCATDAAEKIKYPHPGILPLITRCILADGKHPRMVLM